MATRLYFNNLAPTKTLPTVKGTWTDSSSSVVKQLANKVGIAATAGIASSATTINFLIGRWQSEPFQVATSFATTDTVQYVMGAVVSSITNTVLNFRIHIFIIQNDGTTVRGTLLNNFTGTGTAWTATATGRTSGNQNLSNNVTAQPGDRIVVEIGYNRTGSSTASRTGTLNYGNTGTTDLTSTDTNVTTRPGWIEFSNNFLQVLESHLAQTIQHNQVNIYKAGM